MIWIGIDPGKTGSIAWIDGDNDSTARAYAMPDSPGGMAEIFGRIMEMGSCSAAIEKVSSRTGQGVASMFTFGMHYGMLQGVMAALSVPYQPVTPQRWQSFVGLGGKFAGKKERKAASLNLARSIFPHVDLKRQKDIGRAEALLIAMWARGNRSGA